VGQHRQHRARPRYGRVAAALSSVGITTVALLGGIGLLPTSAGGATETTAVTLKSASTRPEDDSGQVTAGRETTSRTPGTSGVDVDKGKAGSTEPTVVPAESPTYPLPVGSGHGRRAVFSEGQQRVWLVTAAGRVKRTYPVSGSLTDNLDPGTYSVYSRSEQAWGVNDSGTMKWFVRFTTGDTGAAIGFHDIPVDDGKPIQSLSQLGTPQSHGCIRQRHADAIAMWNFASLDTTVVVTR